MSSFISVFFSVTSLAAYKYSTETLLHWFANIIQIADGIKEPQYEPEIHTKTKLRLLLILGSNTHENNMLYTDHWMAFSTS